PGTGEAPRHPRGPADNPAQGLPDETRALADQARAGRGPLAPQALAATNGGPAPVAACPAASSHRHPRLVARSALLFPGGGRSGTARTFPKPGPSFVPTPLWTAYRDVPRRAGEPAFPCQAPRFGH